MTPMTQILTRVDIIERIQLIKENLEAYQDMDLSNFSKKRRELYHDTVRNIKQCLDDYIQMLKDSEKIS